MVSFLAYLNSFKLWFHIVYGSPLCVHQLHTLGGTHHLFVMIHNFDDILHEETILSSLSLSTFWSFCWCIINIVNLQGPFVYTMVDVVNGDITRFNIFLHLTCMHCLLTLEVSHMSRKGGVTMTSPDIDSLLGGGNLRFTSIAKLNILYTYALTQTPKDSSPFWT
jgi:hypothetical protein